MKRKATGLTARTRKPQSWNASVAVWRVHHVWPSVEWQLQVFVLTNAVYAVSVVVTNAVYGSADLLGGGSATASLSE